MVVVATYPNYGAVFFGFVINAASWGFWPVLYVCTPPSLSLTSINTLQAWVNEFCRDDAEERAIVIGVAQTFGQAFIAWVPLLILNVGKYAPRFHLGFSVMSGISVLEFAMIFVLRYFVKREDKQRQAADDAATLAEDALKHEDDSAPRTKTAVDVDIRETSLEGRTTR
jgi:MFS transporter, ACS family, pantothenate transporter